MKIRHFVWIIAVIVAVFGIYQYKDGPAAGTGNEPGHDHAVHQDDKDRQEHDHSASARGDVFQHDAAETGHEAHAHEETAGPDHDTDEAGHRPAEADAHATPEGHDHGHEDLVDLMSPDQASEVGLKTDTIKKGVVSRQIKLTGEVRFNQDRLVHLVPRISGVVAAVNNKLGDHVKPGDVLAVIHSRELTDIKSEYLSAAERIENARINFEREKALWQKKIISERQYLESKQNYTETRIALQSAERKLHALGFSEQYIVGLADQPHQTLFEYRLTAPAAGTIIEKHIVRGELVSTESPVFIIADTTSLWIDLQVYPGDMAAIKTGQKVRISAQNDTLTAVGHISYLSPEINRETRTALARVTLSTDEAGWRSGLFATAVVDTEAENQRHALVVPRSAVQTVDGRASVFVVSSEGYIPAPVKTGLADNTHIEILSGVSEGQTYVSQGAFELKAKLITSTMDGHAGHGH